MTHFCQDHGQPGEEEQAEGELGLEHGNWGWRLIAAAIALALYAGVLAGIWYGQTVGIIETLKQ